MLQTSIYDHVSSLMMMYRKRIDTVLYSLYCTMIHSNELSCNFVSRLICLLLEYYYKYHSILFITTSIISNLYNNNNKYRHAAEQDVMLQLLNINIAKYFTDMDACVKYNAIPVMTLINI